MKSNNWLVISYFANVRGACQSEWVEDRMAALSKLGIRPALVSSFCGGRYKDMLHVRALSLSPADLKFELDFILKRNGISGKLFKVLRTLIFLPLYPLYYLETKILNIYGESRWSWMPFSILMGLIVALKTKPTFIYSTGGPASAHISAIVISKITGIPLMAELQDPLVGDDIGRNALSKKGLKYIEKLIFDNSDKVIFCTQAATDSAAERQHSDKAVCIYPGSIINMPTSSEFVKNAVCKFIYLGSLYQSRNLDCFMEALSMVFEENPELKKYFSLDVYGNMNEDIRQRINNFAHKVIHLKGLVPREDALKHAIESDVLLLVQNTDDRSSTTIPFKTYDYLLLGKKILGLTYKNQELETMMVDHGHLSVAADRPQEIKQAIVALLEDWRNGSLVKSIKSSEITVDNAAKQMQALANVLTASQNGAGV